VQLGVLHECKRLLHALGFAVDTLQLSCPQPLPVVEKGGSAAVAASAAGSSSAPSTFALTALPIVPRGGKRHAHYSWQKETPVSAIVEEVKAAAAGTSYSSDSSTLCMDCRDSYKDQICQNNTSSYAFFRCKLCKGIRCPACMALRQCLPGLWGRRGRRGRWGQQQWRAPSLQRRQKWVLLLWGWHGGCLCYLCC
jgi:hypothetical protein